MSVSGSSSHGKWERDRIPTHINPLLRNTQKLVRILNSPDADWKQDQEKSGPPV